MKNKIITILTLSLLLSACGTKNTTPTTSAPVKKDVFTSIKDAVSKNLTLKCIYSDNNQQTTTYLKGKLVRFSGSGKEIGVEGLMKDDKFYLWNSTDKKGMILEMSKMTSAKMGETPIKSADDVVTQLETKKENCTVSPESDSFFEVPSDINFSAAPDFSGITK